MVIPSKDKWNSNFQEEQPPQKFKQQDGVLSAASKIKERMSTL
jgi:hypothetical protein